MINTVKELARVEGVKVIATNSLTIGDYRVEKSYKTALVYADGENIVNLYPSSDPDLKGVYKEMFSKDLAKYYEVPEDIAETIGEWIYNNF